MAMATVSHTLNHSAAMETVNTQGDSSIPIVDWSRKCSSRVDLSRHTLVISVENRAALREIDGVNRLIDFIGHPERSDLHVFAVMVLSNCLEDPKTMEVSSNARRRYGGAWAGGGEVASGVFCRREGGR